MALRNAKPEFFRPAGLVDGYDQSFQFKGSCQQLQNLMFDQANQGVMVARPGVTLGVDFLVTAPYTTKAPGVISVFLIVGTRIYGMIDTNTTIGFEEPFCYETATGAFITISGITANNVPAKAATTGLWTPPTMAMIGPKIFVTHPGFDGNVPASRFFGVIDVTTPASPAWSSQNTTVHALSAVPTSVNNFNNRAWWTVGNALTYSDSLAPTVVTNANQVLTVGDSSSITATAPLPVGTSTQGILEALLVFKGAAQSTWQITGDAALNTLEMQELSNNIGCWAPRSVVATPEGVKFQGTDGMYVVNLLGVISPLLNNQNNINPDLQTPFIEATKALASRSAASYNQGVYRICVPTISQGNESVADYWFDEHMRRWNGPHTFTYDCAGAIDDKFVLCSNALPGKLFYSQVQQHAASIYTDQTDATTFVTYQCNIISSLMPNRGDMAMNCIQEAEIELGRSSSPSQYNLTALDEFDTILGSAVITLNQSGPLWNTLNWNTHNWATVFPASKVLPIPWTAPIIFKRIALQVYMTAGPGISVGTYSMRYQTLGYMNVAA
jgi:hypothetical protein